MLKTWTLVSYCLYWRPCRIIQFASKVSMYKRWVHQHCHYCIRIPNWLIEPTQHERSPRTTTSHSIKEVISIRLTFVWFLCQMCSCSTPTIYTSSTSLLVRLPVKLTCSIHKELMNLEVSNIRIVPSWKLRLLTCLSIVLLTRCLHPRFRQSGAIVGRRFRPLRGAPLLFCLRPGYVDMLCHWVQVCRNDRTSTTDSRKC